MRVERGTGGGLEIVPDRRRFRRRYARDLNDELPAPAQHAARGVHEDRGRVVQRCAGEVEELGDRAQPLEDRGRAVGARSVPSRKDGVETLEQVAEPEPRVPDIGALVLQPEDGIPQLAQKRGAVDLPLHIVHIQLFHRSRHRTQRGDVSADALLVEPAETTVVRHQTGGARRAGVEVILEVQVGLAEIVYCGHHAPGQDSGFAVTSE